VHAEQEKALRVAMQDGSAASVRRLLYHGASLLDVLNDPRGVISAIGMRGDALMIEALLDSGLPLDGVAALKMLALAAEYDHPAVIELFERRGASSVSTDSARLVAAAGQGDLQLVQELFKQQLDPTVVHGQALRVAMQHRSEPVVAALLEHSQRIGPAPPETHALPQSLLDTGSNPRPDGHILPASSAH